MAHHDVKHPFHLVPPSAWPLATSVAVFITCYSAVLALSGQAPAWIFALGLLLFLACLGGWFQDVIRESVRDKAHTAAVSLGLKMGMGLFIASELMLFVAFFWAYFHSAFGYNPSASIWPPDGTVLFDPWGLPLLNTVILVTSGFVLMWGRGGLKSGNQCRVMAGIGGAALLGFLFILLQIVEYGHAAFGFSDNAYSYVFYAGTGLHGFHVFVGACFLAVCFFRARKGHFTAEKHVGLEAAEWYWHFVDIVWIFLFGWFYIYAAVPA